MKGCVDGECAWSSENDATAACVISAADLCRAERLDEEKHLVAEESGRVNRDQAVGPNYFQQE